ncbi:ATP-dependent helicase [Pseudoduganella namucuonensis]|uniref:DNA 3'-5' helicase n=1 Tax=Pseudoduganella namucuonensis TaxID=1035707 RepID=A0A1I7IAT7_9BURK|nr:UvrD-helicase domain-containing protein [Pseudoduganella namucuonensis]SFU69930.1 DNA helicase-2 / ATP-dependent DNA helicase PcrA [Pseudoduganella namucuonensis]
MNEPNRPRFTPQGLIPTPEQTAIQQAQNKVALVAANAGAAKTTTLALRIGEALAHKLAPEQILALTFTPEARDVMRQRLLDVGIPYASAARVEVATFEDFATAALARLEGGAAERVEQARQLKPCALRALERVAERYTGKVEYLDIRTHNIALSQFLDIQLTLKATMALDGVDAEYIGVEEAAELLKTPLVDYLATLEYETLRKGGDEEVQFRGPYDATYDLACQLSQAPESADALPGYRVVVCDELHDLNEAAFRILNALIARPTCYFVGAGDVDQVIHSKLGASEEFMERRFAQVYPGVKRYPLTHTWRHGPHLAYAMRELKDKPVESSLPLHTEIRQAHYGAGAGCGERVVEAVKAWKRDGFPLEGCAILLRDRHQSIAVENALMQAKIGYRTPAMAGYLQRDEILFLRGMIAIALRDLASVKSLEVRAAIVEALAVFGELPLGPERLESAKREVAKHPQLINDFHKLYIDGEAGGEQRGGGARGLIAAAIDYAAGVDPAAPADVPLRAICAQMDLEQAAKRIFVRPYEASVVSKSVAGFIAAAAASGQTLAEFWQALNAAEAFAGRKREKDFVTIDCAANAKGKEFDHVILPFLEAGEFPSQLADKGEEENLFYVAATRAKARLTLLSPEQPELRSAYIARMRLAATAAGAEQAIARNEAAGAALAPTRYYLSAGIHEAQQVKALGAKFDWPRKAWYVEPGADLEPFRRWLRN